MAGIDFGPKAPDSNRPASTHWLWKRWGKPALTCPKNQTRNVFKLYQDGNLYDYVITVCETSSENQCPLFPGITHRLNWPFDNPETFEGSHEEKLNQVRRVRDEIEARINTWLQEMDDGK